MVDRQCVNCKKYVKYGNVAAHISINYSDQYYCDNCIDGLYQYIKSKLDRKLWVLR